MEVTPEQSAPVWKGDEILLTSYHPRQPESCPLGVLKTVSGMPQSWSDMSSLVRSCFLGDVSSQGVLGAEQLPMPESPHRDSGYPSESKAGYLLHVVKGLGSLSLLVL